MQTKRLSMFSAVLCAVLLSTISLNASALILFDSHELGFVDNGIPSGDGDRTTYVNHLIGMSLGSDDSGDGQHYYRSDNSFGALPTALFNHNGTGTTIDLGAGGFYDYLFAKYDGPNYGSEVWYVGNLSGLITIPGFNPSFNPYIDAEFGSYGLSGWTLFGPGCQRDCVSVPEPGTLALFGLGLVGLALAHRRRALS
jgi:PEP-CTERM motif